MIHYLPCRREDDNCLAEKAGSDQIEKTGIFRRLRYKNVILLQLLGRQNTGGNFEQHGILERSLLKLFDLEKFERKTIRNEFM